MKRRTFLHHSLRLAPGLLAAAPAGAFGEASQVGMGHVRLGSADDPRPEALRRALWETARRTSIDAARDASEVRLSDPALFRHPLLVMHGEKSFAPWREEDRARLLRHLRFGGLLYIDAQRPDCGFVTSVERELDAIFGEALATAPKDHVLFKSFYLLDEVVGRTAADTAVRGLGLNDQRAMVLMTRCDVLGALERDRLGTWTYDCEPGGARQRELAIRFMVNVMMLATCLDYKADQVHIPFIMKKTRR